LKLWNFGPRTKVCIYSKPRAEDFRASRRRSRSPGVRKGNRSRLPETRKGQRGGYYERECYRDTVDTSLEDLVDTLGGILVGLEVEDDVGGDEES
jgi:hypothetical protein